MAGPALIPDIAPSRAEKTALRGGAQRAEASREKAFARVQQDVAKAARGEAGRAKNSPATNEPARNSDKSLRQGAKDAEQAPIDPADSTSAGGDAGAILPAQELEPGSGAPLAAELLNPDDDTFALLAPALPSGSRGNKLPPALTLAAGSAPAAGLPPVAATLAEANGLQQMFLKMAKGGDAGAETGAKADAGVDLESFKASLSEALESRGSRPADAAPPSLLSSQRGLELREGSALVRQYSTSVDTPVQQGDWGDKMAGKISWLANQRISFAEIHLNPADLGPIEVRVNVQNDQASVAVHAQNASVRDLLELNGNRLREMLQDNGLNLAKMEVSDQPPRQQQQAAGGEAGQGAGSGENDGAAAAAGSLVSLDGEAISTGEMHLQWQSQVDTYA